jgi:D-amino-acid dehydrogenase
MEQHDDVVIVGAGVIGLASALALIESGRRVRVIDAGHVGGGSSHGNCGTITPSHAPPLAAPGTVLKALRWMLTPDAPLYIPPRWDRRCGAGCCASPRAATSATGASVPWPSRRC